MKAKTKNMEGILKARQLWRDRQSQKQELREKNALKRSKRDAQVQLNVISRKRGKSKKETRRLLDEVSS